MSELHKQTAQHIREMIDDKNKEIEALESEIAKLQNVLRQVNRAFYEQQENQTHIG